MADPLDATVEVSLGQLAVAQRVITVAQRDHLGVQLLRRATAKNPTSMARLLVQAGLTAEQVRALLARGAHFPAVRCDACELSIPQGQLRREEVPCARCGSLVLGFAAYAAPPGERSQADDETTTTGPAPDAADMTERWGTVLPVPAAPRPGRATARWSGVLPLPGEAGAEDAHERTMTFEGVLTAPGDGTVNLPPGTTESGDELDASPAPPGTSTSGAGRGGDADRTIAFGDVFLLPGRSGPRPEREVSDEMHTLMAPAGFTALAEAESAPVLPAGFDPGAVTAPMAKDEIQAMLRKGPPPEARAPRSAPPRPAPSPIPAPEPAARAPARIKTDQSKRPAPAPARRGWGVVVLGAVVLLALAGGGVYAAFRFGWLGV